MSVLMWLFMIAVVDFMLLWMMSFFLYIPISIYNSLRCCQLSPLISLNRCLIKSVGFNKELQQWVYTSDDRLTSLGCCNVAAFLTRSNAISTIEPTIKNTKNRHENPKQNHTKKPHKFTKNTRYKLKSTYQRC